MRSPAIGTYELFAKFSTEASARRHPERVRWGGKPECPRCKSRAIYKRTDNRLGSYDCRECQKTFTVRTGTVFERSHIKLNQ